MELTLAHSKNRKASRAGSKCHEMRVTTDKYKEVGRAVAQCTWKTTERILDFTLSNGPLENSKQGTVIIRFTFKIITLAAKCGLSKE